MDTDGKTHIKNETLLSRNEMIEWLYNYLRSDSIQQRDIKSTTLENKPGIKFYCFRCEILQEYISEMSRIVKSAVLSNVHDSFVVFLNHFITNLDYKNISKKDWDGVFKDLINGLERYEQKTAVNVPRDGFGSFVRKHLNKVVDSLEKKDIWWFVSLYKLDENKLPKDIKHTICSYYLVCMSLDTKAAKLQQYSDQKSKLAQEMEINQIGNEEVEKLIKQVEEEDEFPEGILFPVKNTIIVDELRRQVEHKDRILQEEEQKRKEEEQKRKKIEQKNKQLENNIQTLISFLKEQGIPEEKIKKQLEEQ